MKPLNFAARSLRREFRHGELATLGLALVLAVAALSAVGTLASRVESAILASAAELLGGDLGVRSRSALPDTLTTRAKADGLAANTFVEFQSVVFAGESTQFVEVRATDPAFPLRGELAIRDADGNERVVGAPDSGEVYVDARVRDALKQPLGGTLQLGGRDLRIVGDIVRSPDGGEAFNFAPRVLMALADAQASGLLGTGSRASYRLMLAGDAASIARFADQVKPDLPKNAQLVTLESAQQNLRTAFDRAEGFLRLAALLAALLAGIAVALAAQRFARRKVEEVAVLRCLGASRNEITLALILELLLLAIPACMVGLAAGIGLQQVAFAFAGDLLPGAAPAIPAGPGLSAIAIGLAVLFGFALPPLLRLREVEPMRVFRQELAGRSRRFDVLYLLPVAVGAALIMFQAGNLQLAQTLALGLAAVAVAALLLGLLLIRVLRVSGQRLPGSIRFGLANLARRRSLSVIQAGALAMSLTALNLLAVVGPSLLESWRAELPADTPNWFMLNLQSDQSDAMRTQLVGLGADNIGMLPLAVGKFVAINGKPLNPADFDAERAANWINGEIRVSWSDKLPDANRTTEGRWIDPQATEPEVSMAGMWMDMFKLKVGDQLTLRIGDREISPRIVGVRDVDWDSFKVNFFMMLDPVHAESLPHSFLTSFHLPATQAGALGSVVRAVPNVSLVDVNAILERVRELIARVSMAVTWVLGFSLAAGVLVLLAALASTADERRFESALLRTLGATSGQLRAAVLSEFAAVGLLAGLIAAFGAAMTGIALARTAFRLDDYMPPWSGLTLSTLIAVLFVTVAGAVGTRKIARTPPMLVLRSSG
ncbi:MAG: FtsX-like permease family protein [Dokdonella sp.]